MSRIKYIGHQQELDHVAGSYPLTWVEMIDSTGINYEQQVEVFNQWNLSRRQMECISLYYVEKKTQREIAEILNISQPNVCIYIKRAKKKINKCISNRY